MGIFLGNDLPLDFNALVCIREFLLTYLQLRAMIRIKKFSDTWTLIGPTTYALLMI